jgi:hypothetical protein
VKTYPGITARENPLNSPTFDHLHDSSLTVPIAVAIGQCGKARSVVLSYVSGAKMLQKRREHPAFSKRTN